MRENISAHIKTKICMLKNEIKILKNILNEKPIYRFELIKNYNHDDYKNANTKLEPENY